MARVRRIRTSPPDELSAFAALSNEAGAELGPRSAAVPFAFFFSICTRRDAASFSVRVRSFLCCIIVVIFTICYCIFVVDIVVRVHTERHILRDNIDRTRANRFPLYDASSCKRVMYAACVPISRPLGRDLGIFISGNSICIVSDSIRSAPPQCHRKISSVSLGRALVFLT